MKPDQIAYDYLVEGIQILGLNILDADLQLLLNFFDLLTEKSKVMNLISSKQDLKTKIDIHLIDSLSLLAWDKLPAEADLLDFGSGGGLPGIPLSICRPAWSCTLVDSKAKKIRFIETVKNELNLDNVRPKSLFLELGRNPEKEFYSLVTARAVSSLDTLAAIAGPRLKKGGLFAAYKGPQVDDEIKEAQAGLKKWGLELFDELRFKLPLGGADRVIAIFKKL